MIKSMTVQLTKVSTKVKLFNLFLLNGVFSLFLIFLKKRIISFLKITPTIKYGMNIKKRIPVFKPCATELGLFCKSLSAAALHMAHCE
jgi:hypothetical protein